MKRQIVRDLEFIIEVNGLTYEEVAEEIDMSYSTFASLMSRDTYPHKENLRKIKDYIIEHLEISKRREKYMPIRIRTGVYGGKPIEESAEEIGISAKCLQDIIDGKAEPSRLTLIAIENWMECTLEYLNRIKAECRRTEELEDELEQQQKARQARKKARLTK